MASVELPETVRDAVLARTEALGDEARGLLEVVALVPGRSELWLVEAVAPDAVEQIDRCLAAGVLREVDHAIAYRHELARLALESSVPAARRRRLHGALLAALLAAPQGAAPSRLAHHAERAGDTAAVLEHAPEAATAASGVGARREAAQQYARRSGSRTARARGPAPRCSTPMRSRRR